MSLFKKIITWALFPAILLYCYSALATFELNKNEEIAIKISGEILNPTCTINHGTPIEIDFGTLKANLINGKNYAQEKSIEIDCGFDTQNSAPYIKVLGQRLAGLEHVLKTNENNTNHASLGIALYQGSAIDEAHKLIIGQGAQNNGYKIEYGFKRASAEKGTFTFTAVPYKFGTTPLIAGEFSANAQISIAYR